MSVTQMTSANALTVKLWALEDFIEGYKSSVFGRAAKRGTIMRAAELDNAKAGDTITFSFTGILTGIGIGEGGTLENNEEALDLQSYTMNWNVYRHAVANPNDDTIEQVRTLVPFEQNARKQLRDFMCSRMDASFFNQLAGVNSTTITVDTTTYSGTNRQFVQGLNSIAAPSTNRILRAGGQANDESLTSSNTMTLDLIDAAIEKFVDTYPTVESLEGETFDLYLAPAQWLDVKRDAGSRIQYYNNALAEVTSGKSNPLSDMTMYSVQPVYQYSKVNIIPATRVPQGVNSSTSAAIPTVRRAILCGKNAAAFASRFSGALDDIGPDGTDGNTPLIYKTALRDFDYIKAIEARLIYGLKKIQFSSEDYGSLVISTYAASHSF